MRIFYLGNNRVGFEVLKWLLAENEEIIGLALHPPNRAKFRDEIAAAFGNQQNHVFEGSRLRVPQVLKSIERLKPDIGISAFFGYILTVDFIRIFPRGVINIHPAYLPYNRGAFPNVWSIIDGTPAGATVHYIDAGVDTGDIVSRVEVPVEPVDTGKTLYEKLEQASIELFKSTWPNVRDGQTSRIGQSADKGSFHLVDDVDQIDCIDLDRHYQARHLIDVIRARTFPPHRGAYFVHEGRKVFLNLSLEFAEES